MLRFRRTVIEGTYVRRQLCSISMPRLLCCKIILGVRSQDTLRRPKISKLHDRRRPWHLCALFHEHVVRLDVSVEEATTVQESKSVCCLRHQLHDVTISSHAYAHEVKVAPF